MSIDNTLQEFVKTVKEETAGFIAISVLSVEDSIVLASETAKKDFDVENLSPVHSEIFIKTISSLKRFNPSNSDEVLLDEILLTTKDEFYILSSSPDHKFLAILIVNKHESNLGLARMSLNKHRNTVGADIDKNL